MIQISTKVETVWLKGQRWLCCYALPPLYIKESESIAYIIPFATISNMSDHQAMNHEGTRSIAILHIIEIKRAVP
jgi:hypothetical protein